MKIEGYVGICTCCFEPVKQGEEYPFTGSKATFHTRCVELNPNSYYIRRERRRSAKLSRIRSIEDEQSYSRN